VIRNERVRLSQQKPCADCYEYSGYIVSAWARPEFATGSASGGIVYKRCQLGSIIQVQRIEGELFESKDEAEQHGLELCKKWIAVRPKHLKRVGPISAMELLQQN